MDKLKKIFSPGHDKDDEVMYDKPGSSLAEDTGTSSGRVEGHDSHFGSKRSEQPREASMTQPRSTSGYTETGTSGPHSTEMLNKADPRVDADLKRTGVDAARGATPGTGEAAIGQTATYGSYSVGLGDRTSSTIDPSSEDPTTFQRPEKAYIDSGSGIGGANAFDHGNLDESLRTSTDPVSGNAMAGTAADVAWNKHKKGADSMSGGAMPGGFPKEDYENPYRAAHLDPRVDSSPRPTTQAPSAPVNQSTGSPLRNTSATAGVASLGGAESLISSRRSAPESAERTARGDAGSSLFSASDTASRSSKYDTAAGRNVPAPTSTASGADDPAISTPRSTTPPEESIGSRFSGMLGGASSALGFGDATVKHDEDRNLNTGASNPATTGTSAISHGTAAGQHTSFYTAATSGAPSQSTQQSTQPSTMTQSEPSVTRGTEMSSIPIRSGQPLSQHREESMPTTANPSGTLDSSWPSASGHETRYNPEGRVHEHHHGRDAALGAEAVGGGVGAYEMGKDHQEELAPDFRKEPASTPSTSGWTGAAEPSGSRPRDFPTSQPPASEVTILKPGQYDRPSRTADATTAAVPISKSDTAAYHGQSEGHQYGRDAGAAAVGAGVGGTRPHEYESHRGGAERPYPVASQQPFSNEYDAPSNPQAVQQERQGESYYGRDAALGGAAVAGAGAAGYEYSDRERLAARQKDVDEERREAERRFRKEQEAAEKAEMHRRHEEKRRQHELEKQKEHEEKAHHKALAKEERREAAAAAAEAQQEGKNKKPSIFGFLKRRKNKDTGEDEEYTSETDEGLGLTGAAYEGEHHHNKLHKDPPAGHPAAGAPESTSYARGVAAATPAYHDAPVYEDGHPGATTIQGGSTMQEDRRESARYAEPPKKGYASQVTGGTGTTALAQGEPEPTGSHSTSAGNIMDSKVGPQDTTAAGSLEGVRDDIPHQEGTYEHSQGPLTHGHHTTHPGHPDSGALDSREGNKVIEPTTGLPVDTSKGTGEGGTDGGPQPSLFDRLLGRHPE